MDQNKNNALISDELYRCPCCRYLTLSEPSSYEICPVCFWEDDGQDDEDADEVRGGPNGSLSLTQARINFENFGACEERHIKNVIINPDKHFKMAFK
jgi:hypothetical protein